MNGRIQCAVLSLAWILGILGKQQRFIQLSSSCRIPRESRLQLNAHLNCGQIHVNILSLKWFVFIFHLHLKWLWREMSSCWWSACCWCFPAKHVWTELDICSNKSVWLHALKQKGAVVGLEGRNATTKVCVKSWRSTNTNLFFISLPRSERAHSLMNIGRNSHQRDFNFFFVFLDSIHMLFFSALTSTFSPVPLFLSWCLFL